MKKRRVMQREGALPSNPGPPVGPGSLDEGICLGCAGSRLDCDTRSLHEEHE